MAEGDKYGLWDTKLQSWVRNREYDSLKGASRGSDRMDNAYGGVRYVPKLIPGQTPQKTSSADMEQDVVTAKRGGYVRSADGIAQRGKTRGRLV